MGRWVGRQARKQAGRWAGTAAGPPAGESARPVPKACPARNAELRGPWPHGGPAAGPPHTHTHTRTHAHARGRTWTCATRGGMTSPLSSPWVMTMTPMERVVSPQEFCHACARVFSSVSNSMPNILHGGGGGRCVCRGGWCNRWLLEGRQWQGQLQRAPVPPRRRARRHVAAAECGCHAAGPRPPGPPTWRSSGPGSARWRPGCRARSAG